jgi:hypothetical protein
MLYPPPSTTNLSPILSTTFCWKKFLVLLQSTVVFWWDAQYVYLFEKHWKSFWTSEECKSIALNFVLHVAFKYILVVLYMLCAMCIIYLWSLCLFVILIFQSCTSYVYLGYQSEWDPLWPHQGWPKWVSHLIIEKKWRWGSTKANNNNIWFSYSSLYL